VGTPAPVGWQHCPTIDEEGGLVQEAVIFDIISELRDAHVFESLRIVAVMINSLEALPKGRKQL
jgi:hypothetical protein